MRRTFFTGSEEETMNLASKLARIVPPSTVICLMGDLGAGKTTFVKGFALGLGIKDTITSPTFNIMKVYPLSGEGMLVHIDAYRLYNEVIDIGLDEFIGDENSYTLIEWPAYIEELIPFMSIKVDISIISDHERRIEINASSEYVEAL